MRQPSRSNAATLDEGLGSPLTPWRHERFGPRDGEIQRKVEVSVVVEPRLSKMGNTTRNDEAMPKGKGDEADV